MELIVVCTIVAALISVVVPFFKVRVDNANYIKMTTELTTIAGAATKYYAANGNCTAGLSGLAPAFMPNVVTTSPFNTPYGQPVCTGGMVTVSVSIPSGIAEGRPLGELTVVGQGPQDQITISDVAHNSLTGWLKYQNPNAR